MVSTAFSTSSAICVTSRGSSCGRRIFFTFQFSLFRGLLSFSFLLESLKTLLSCFLHFFLLFPDFHLLFSFLRNSGFNFIVVEFASFFQLLPHLQKTILQLPHLFMLLNFDIASLSSFCRYRVKGFGALRHVPLALPPHATSAYMAAIGLYMTAGRRSSDRG